MIPQGKITAIIQKLSEKKGTPDPDESLFDAGYLDSFGLADLVADIEKEFVISIPDSDVTPRTFDSISRIQTYLEEHGG